MIKSSKILVSNIFDAAQAGNWADILKASIKAPYVNAKVSTLGGPQRPTIMLTISADPRETWVNGILQNSTYANFSIDHTGALELFSGGRKYLPDGSSRSIKFRKTRVTSAEQAVAKLNAWVQEAQQ